MAVALDQSRPLRLRTVVFPSVEEVLNMPMYIVLVRFRDLAD